MVRMVRTGFPDSCVKYQEIEEPFGVMEDVMSIIWIQKGCKLDLFTHTYI